MANVIVTEFSGTLRDGKVQAAYVPITSQVVAIGGSSAATTNAFNGGASVIRVFAEADCTIVIAVTPNAGSGVKIPLAAGQFDYFAVEPGMKVAVIARTVA